MGLHRLSKATGRQRRDRSVRAAAELESGEYLDGIQKASNGYCYHDRVATTRLDDSRRLPGPARPGRGTHPVAQVEESLIRRARKRTFGRARRLSASMPRATATVARTLPMPRLRHHCLTLPQLPYEWEGLRIAQIADVHAGPFMPIERMTSVVELVMAERPDLIVFTGDQLDRHPSDADLFSEGFQGLDAPMGVWGILGNHDHYFDPEISVRALQRAGIEPLVNRSVSLERDGSRLVLAGVDDLWASSSRGPDFSVIRSDRSTSAAFRVCLCHQPQGWLQAAEAGAHLTLAGHTHGGQIVLTHPRLSIARLHTRFIAGPYRRDDAFLYVSRGIGVGALPVRVGAPREVDILTLRRAGAAPRIATEEQAA